jgi:hypothetical protein
MNHTTRLWFVAAALAVASFGIPRNASASTIDIPNANIWMAWNSCHGTAGAVENLHYACDGSNAGTPVKLVFSFELPNTYPTYHFSISMVTIRIRTLDGSAFPDYWRIQLADYGGCRVGVGDVSPGNYGFAMFGPGIVDADHCASWYGVAPAGSHEGVSLAYPPAIGSDRINVEGATAAAFGTSAGVDISAGSKLAGGAMLLDTEPGGCAGCQQEMTIELQSFDLSSCCGIPAYHLTGSGPGTVVSWQANTTGPTVARNRTWGSVKALYR